MGLYSGTSPRAIAVVSRQPCFPFHKDIFHTVVLSVLVGWHWHIFFFLYMYTQACIYMYIQARCQFVKIPVPAYLNKNDIFLQATFVIPPTQSS